MTTTIETKALSQSRPSNRSDDSIYPGLAIQASDDGLPSPDSDAVDELAQDGWRAMSTMTRSEECNGVERRRRDPRKMSRGDGGKCRRSTLRRLFDAAGKRQALDPRRTANGGTLECRLELETAGGCRCGEGVVGGVLGFLGGGGWAGVSRLAWLKRFSARVAGDGSSGT